MNQDDRGAVWFVIGVGGAVALGVILIALRTIVPASTLAFVFIALTIVVAEMGGRGPGLATAVVSALSLNFFLTEPYLSLEIDKPGDIAAFIALAACGLIAAAFGKRRVRTAEQVSRTRGELEVLGADRGQPRGAGPDRGRAGGSPAGLRPRRPRAAAGGRAPHRGRAAEPSLAPASLGRARAVHAGRDPRAGARAGPDGVPIPARRRAAPAPGPRAPRPGSLGGKYRGLHPG